MKKLAGKQWRKSQHNYCSGLCGQLTGIMGERAFRMTDIAARWNIVQHFYPYYEEDSLRWKSRLEDMIVAVDTLKSGKLSREDFVLYHQTIVKAMSPVRDAHLEIYKALNPGYGIVSCYLSEYDSTSAAVSDTGSAEMEIRADVIDSILIFNPSLSRLHRRPEIQGRVF